MPMGPYEAGLTPEEREEQAYGYAPPPMRGSILGNQTMHQGARVRMATRNPLAALLLAGLLGPQAKLGSVVLGAFGDELQRILKKE
jgi:hypothetical protein